MSVRAARRQARFWYRRARGFARMGDQRGYAIAMRNVVIFGELAAR